MSPKTDRVPAAVVPSSVEDTTPTTAPVEEQGLTPTVSIVQHAAVPKSVLDIPPQVLPQRESAAAAAGGKPYYSSSDDGFYLSSLSSSPEQKEQTLERPAAEKETQKEQVETDTDETKLTVFQLPPGTVISFVSLINRFCD